MCDLSFGFWSFVIDYSILCVLVKIILVIKMASNSFLYVQWAGKVVYLVY